MQSLLPPSAQRKLSGFERARRYVNKIPGAVEGNHGDNETLLVANVLVWDFALSHAEALAIFREYNERCSPKWSEAELLRKLHSAEKQRHIKPRGNRLSVSTPSQKPPPQSVKHIDPVTTVENFLKGSRCTPADLIAASECKIPSLICGAQFHRQGAYLIDQLFEPGECVNIVKKAIVESDKARPGDAGLTLERNEWQERLLEPMEAHPGGVWLRMNPLDGRGVADANVAAYRFALLESDDLPLDLALSLFAKLPIPIAAIISSGGRGPHAWVRVDACNSEEYRRVVAALLSTLEPFGIDAANKNPSRLSRLPGVTRTIGAAGDGKQTLLFLNPSPDGSPIL